MPCYYGIDLGTTNCSLAYSTGTQEGLISIEAGQALIMPSVVEFLNDGTINVGQAAKDDYIDKIKLVVKEIKKEMGNKEYRFNGCSPEEISAYILKKIVLKARQTNNIIRESVVSVPAYFNFSERLATKIAAECAGIRVIRIVNEPTAAALYYSKTRKDLVGETVLVFDLGGGTLDLSLAEIKQDNVNILCTGGIRNLGGTDWDNRLQDYVIEKFAQESHLSETCLRNDEEFIKGLYLNIESLKIDLSSFEKTSILVKYQQLTDNIDIQKNIDVTREEFERITSGLLHQVLNKMEDFVSTAKQIINQDNNFPFNRILLVGGATIMPQIQNALQERYPDKILEMQPPNNALFAVACGAAILAHNIETRGFDDLSICDVISRSYGEKIFSIAQHKQLVVSNFPSVMNFMAQNNMTYLGFHLANKKVNGSTVIEIGETLDLKTVLYKNPLTTGTDIAINISINDDNKLNINVAVDNNTYKIEFSTPFTDDMILEIEERYFHIQNMIIINSQIPTTKTRKFRTGTHNISSISSTVCESLSTEEFVELSDCTIITEASTNVQQLPYNSPLETTYDYDENGLLTIHCIDKTNNIPLKTEVQADGLSRQEIDNIKFKLQNASINNRSI
ncbi:MAG: Hsp70 family protein [Clostridiales bacterium]|nr:Hsp70 family protein [Clostridiales bacterium]